MRYEQMKQLAAGRELQLLQNAGIEDRYMTGKHGRCFRCGGDSKANRARFDRNKSMFYCNNCGGKERSGGYFDMFEAVASWNKWSDKQAREWFKQQLGGFSSIITNDNASNTVVDEAQKKDLAALRKMMQLHAERKVVTEDSPSFLYAQKRGIHKTLAKVSDLFHHNGITLWRKRDGGLDGVDYPALICLFRNKQNKIVEIQQLLLTRTGEKAKLEQPKRFMKSIEDRAMTGGAVRLMTAGTVLGIGEGFETCLSAHLMFQVPVWACLTAQLLAAFEPPTEVGTVLIFADNDESTTGIRKAKELAVRLVREGKKVKIFMPNKAGKDFNDLLMAKSQDYSEVSFK